MDVRVRVREPVALSVLERLKKMAARGVVQPIDEDPGTDRRHPTIGRCPTQSDSRAQCSINATMCA